jgi:5-oxoprolinase (ATP-hydrolysing)
LSSSALRGTVERQLDPLRLAVRVTWACPRDFIRGFRFRLLGDHQEEALVKGFDPKPSVLELEAALSAPVEEGEAFEVLSPEEAPLLAARLVTRSLPSAPLPPIEMRLATTRGTNALLERRGVPVAFFITRGFGDLLRIGTQQRPDLFQLHIQRAEPLYQAVIEVPERVAADGSILEPLDEARLGPEVDRALDRGIRTAAVALLHSPVQPIHERKLKDLLLGKGFQHVSMSSEVAPFIKILPRAETAVVDAYLSPVIQGYLHRVGSLLPGGRLQVMTSSGGLIRAEAYRAKDSLLSGPAAGVSGAALAGKRSGSQRLISFDMGGTSTDVARFDGDFEYVFEHEVGEAHLVSPALAIESVAAGGGSICFFDGKRLRVGPESAGASPGPAAYGAGGPLTLTDVNLLLGRLAPERFQLPIHVQDSEEELGRLLETIDAESGESASREAILEGLLDIANERMAGAIRKISIRRGYDPRGYALVTFGGAGGQHACGVAERLGMETIIVPRDAGLLSALGLGQAVFERFAERQVLEDLATAEAKVPALLRELEREATEALVENGIPESEVEARRRMVHLRFRGQDSVVSIEHRDGARLGEAFRERYRSIFGHLPEERPIEVESIRVVVSSRSKGESSGFGEVRPSEGAPASQRRAFLGGKWLEVPVYERSTFSPGTRFEGPALVFEAHSATLVEPGWRLEVDGTGALVLRRAAAGREKAEPTSGGRARAGSETVQLELFTNRFRFLAQEMGEMLRRTALSTNVKERLDFSCALIDPEGELVVNAPHIPVHLGAMGLCVRRLRETLPIEPGDVLVTNHPAFGGSHLPDVTVVTPVFKGTRLLGYVGSRAHHAEIGGVCPGSMPPRATRLVEEGVVIPPMHLARGGQAEWPRLRQILARAPFPSRAVEENLADLRAAVAANERGAAALRSLEAAHGAEAVLHYMDALKKLADRQVRDALLRLGEGSWEAVEELDDGSPLRVKIEVSRDQAVLDFTGSSPVHPGNLNATPGIVRSAVLYVLRLLVKEPLPLNEGLLRAVTLRVPPSILNPPFEEDPARCPAVVGGNVETSQRLVDTLLKALGLAASSQGTMNNVLFGTKSFSYYETVGGGSGAGPGFEGASAVHTHMTNTRITDPEIIEHRYPARLERFAIREGSGGGGQYRGGDGAVREITFLEPMTLSVLSQHRKLGPYGLSGGEAGKPGAQRVVRATGETVTLAPVDGLEVGPGDRFILETPGGGGWGKGVILPRT